MDEWEIPWKSTESVYRRFRQFCREWELATGVPLPDDEALILWVTRKMATGDLMKSSSLEYCIKVQAACKRAGSTVVDGAVDGRRGLHEVPPPSRSFAPLAAGRPLHDATTSLGGAASGADHHHAMCVERRVGGGGASSDTS